MCERMKAHIRSVHLEKSIKKLKKEYETVGVNMKYIGFYK